MYVHSYETIIVNDEVMNLKEGGTGYIGWVGQRCHSNVNKVFIYCQNVI